MDRDVSRKRKPLLSQTPGLQKLLGVFSLKRHARTKECLAWKKGEQEKIRELRNEEKPNERGCRVGDLCGDGQGGGGVVECGGADNVASRLRCDTNLAVSFVRSRGITSGESPGRMRTMGVECLRCGHRAFCGAATRHRGGRSFPAHAIISLTWILSYVAGEASADNVSRKGGRLRILYRGRLGQLVSEKRLDEESTKREVSLIPLPRGTSRKPGT
ncbi:hypothetical protein MRX96_000613 [Rhipicephalus microplus]